MSVRVMAWVWEHSKSVGSDRLVLLAIADCANDAGRDAYPAMSTIARKANVDKRTAQRSVRALVELGELAVHENAGPHGTHRYRLLMDAGRQSATGGNPPPRQDATPGESPRVADDHSGISSLKGRQAATRTVLEPSSTPQPPASGGRQRKRAHCPRHVRHNSNCTECVRLEERAQRQASWPAWCGECDENTRKLADELLSRCPNCHPLRTVS